mmetsp:Transcript_6866/g.16847  ORF Transcript_6866/g.16847 Transcript_6866/m.16847 type:complete len:305 (+) Transcript_6866:754-1668(+)
MPLGLGGLAPGHVQMGARQAQRRTAVVPLHDAGAAVDPDPVAAAMAHPELLVVFGLFVLDHLRGGGLARGQVVRVNQPTPQLDAGFTQLVEAVAEHVGPALVDLQQAGAQIPFPGAGTGCVQHVVQALPLCREGLLLAPQRALLGDRGGHIGDLDQGAALTLAADRGDPDQLVQALAALGRGGVGKQRQRRRVERAGQHRRHALGAARLHGREQAAGPHRREGLGQRESDQFRRRALGALRQPLVDHLDAVFAVEQQQPQMQPVGQARGPGEAGSLKHQDSPCRNSASRILRPWVELRSSRKAR